MVSVGSSESVAPSLAVCNILRGTEEEQEDVFFKRPLPEVVTNAAMCEVGGRRVDVSVLDHVSLTEAAAGRDNLIRNIFGINLSKLTDKIINSSSPGSPTCRRARAPPHVGTDHITNNRIHILLFLFAVLPVRRFRATSTCCSGCFLLVLAVGIWQVQLGTSVQSSEVHNSDGILKILIQKMAKGRVTGQRPVTRVTPSKFS